MCFFKHKSKQDPIEIELKYEFNYLVNDYNFSFAKKDIGNAVDKDGKFFFYGPVICYQFFNDKVCINILNLVQRQDFDIYITQEHELDQKSIRNGICGSDYHAYHFLCFACDVRQSIETNGEIYGVKI